MSGESGPRSGKNKPKKHKPTRKAIMSEKAWDLLTSKQQSDLGGSRWKNVGQRDEQRGGADDSGGDR